MNLFQKIGLFILFTAISLPLKMCGQQSADQIHIERIIKTIDELYRTESSYAEMDMEIVTPYWQRTLKMKIWTKGMNETFIRILAPAKEKGIATLRIEKEMWNFLPKTNKVIKIPPSMMMSSWMGSDFNNDDLVNEFSLIEDYTYSFITPPDADQELLYIQCIPKPDLPVVWGKINLSVREKDYIPVKEEYYDEKGELMRIINYKDITVYDGRKIPAIIELIPQKKEGHKTVLKYLDAKFNIPIDHEIFSLRNLRTIN